MYKLGEETRLMYFLFGLGFGRRGAALHLNKVQGRRQPEDENGGGIMYQKVELAALASMPDADIDMSDIPDTKVFPNPRRGVFSDSPNRKVGLATAQF